MIPKKTLPTVPMGIHPEMRNFLQGVRNAIHGLHAGMVPPQPVSNLDAVPIPGGNRVRFTRTDADYYVAYISSTPSLGKAQVVDLGISNLFDDLDGQGGVLKYYWIRAKKLGTADSVAVGPVSSTSQAPGTPQSIPAPPPISKIITTDEVTGNQTAIHYAGGQPQKEL